MESYFSAAFLWFFLQIIAIDVLLGGDNAVVIGLACRGLPATQRTRGVIAGTAGAILVRVILVLFALTLLELPYLKLLGSGLLLWIGIKLLIPGTANGDGHGDVDSSVRLWSAIRTVIVADVAMSFDNVIAIAGVAETAGGEHKMPLVVLGLLISIPIIVAGSQLVLRLMDRFPIVITLGGMLLGWIAGSMAVSDSAVSAFLPAGAAFHYTAAAAGAVIVLLASRIVIARRSRTA